MRLTTENHGSVTLVTVDGDVDLATSGDLEAALDATESDVILDLRRVGFMDSSGLNSLLTASRKLAERSRRLALVIERAGAVGRLFDITQLGDVFTWFEEIDAAVAALDAGEGA